MLPLRTGVPRQRKGLVNDIQRAVVVDEAAVRIDFGVHPCPESDRLADIGGAREKVLVHTRVCRRETGQGNA